MTDKMNGSKDPGDNPEKFNEMLRALRRSHEEIETVIKTSQEHMRVFYPGRVWTPSDHKQVEEIAFHEAGHAVIAKLIGPDTYSISLVNLNNPFSRLGGYFSTHQSFGKDVGGARSQIVFHMAGGAAVRHFFPGIDAMDFVDRKDAQSVARNILGLVASDEAIEEEVMRGKEIAENLVVKHQQQIAEVAGMMLAFTGIMERIAPMDSGERSQAGISLKGE